MRRIAAFFLAVVCIVLPFTGSAHALKLVEGDRGWDCRTMGNRSCGPTVAKLAGLIEGQPGWDCRTMGNATCGTAASDDLASVLALPAAAGTTERVNVSSDEVQADAAGSEQADISGNGRFVAFTSAATNLVPNDTNGVTDIFVRDRVLGTTERVSVGSAEEQATGASSGPSISANGRLVAFASAASNFVGGDSNDSQDVFVRDRHLGTTELVSVGLLGGDPTSSHPGNAHSIEPDISADGRFVAFSSLADNLALDEVAIDAAGPAFPVVEDIDERLIEVDDFFDVFVRDRRLNVTERVSVNPLGLPATMPIPDELPHSREPAISDDGRIVAFSSLATNFELDLAVSLDPPGLSIYPQNSFSSDIFVRDRLTRTTESISAGPAGPEPPPSGSFAPDVSSTGRFVSFTSRENFTTNPCGTFCIYVHDRSNGVKHQIEGNGGSISASGTRVAFTSPIAHAPEDASSQLDAYLWLRPAGTTILESVSTAGVQADAQSFARAVSRDGVVVGFTSDGTNLVDGDTNGVRDLFVHVN